MTGHIISRSMGSHSMSNYSTMCWPSMSQAWHQCSTPQERIISDLMESQPMRFDSSGRSASMRAEQLFAPTMEAIISCQMALHCTKNAGLGVATIRKGAAWCMMLKAITTI